MTVFPARATPTRLTLRSMRAIAVARSGAAGLWALVFLVALHGRVVPTGSDIPLPEGLLLAAYPLIDAAASLLERRCQPLRTQPHAALVVDGLAIIGLLVATPTLHTGLVLIAFGTWAFASGLLQLVRAWGAGTSRRAQLPLIISGGISAIAGITFAAQAGQRTAHLANLGGYALLGTVFFLVWTLLNRTRSTRTGAKSDASDVREREPSDS